MMQLLLSVIPIQTKESMKTVTKMAHFKENLMKTFFSLRYIDEDRFNRALSS
jgi:hypothetical protein